MVVLTWLMHRHMVGMNMATALAFPVAIALSISMMHQALTAHGRVASVFRT